MVLELFLLKGRGKSFNVRKAKSVLFAFLNFAMYKMDFSEFPWLNPVMLARCQLLPDSGKEHFVTMIKAILLPFEW